MILIPAILLDSLPALQATRDFLADACAALLGTGVGAWAGAWAAQRIAVQPRVRDELTLEIRNTNAAINLAFLIANLSLSLKGHHVKPMKESYAAKRAEFKLFSRMQHEGRSPPGAHFALAADFEALGTLLVPVEPLQRIVLDKLSLVGRAHVLTPMLFQVVYSLNASIVERNRLIEEFRANRREGDNAQLFSFYFGQRDAAGNVDNRFAASIEAIYQYTDNTIAFAKMLIKDLGVHGDALNSKLVLVGGKGLTIMKPDFFKAFNAGLMPDDAEYSDWETMFVRKANMLPKSRMRRLHRKYVAPLSVRWRRAVRPVLRHVNGRLGEKRAELETSCTLRIVWLGSERHSRGALPLHRDLQHALAPLQGELPDPRTLFQRHAATLLGAREGRGSGAANSDGGTRPPS